MAIIGTLESKSATLADCYHEVVLLAAIIDGISTNSSNLRITVQQCLVKDGQTSMMISTYWHISCTQACEEKALLEAFFHELLKLQLRCGKTRAMVNLVQCD